MGSPKTLLLTKGDIDGLLSMQGYIDAVEDAFRMHAEGKTLKPDMLHIDAVDGEFHIKAGGLELETRYFGLKVNGDFPHNPGEFGMPSMRGLILLFDGENGYPLAVLDSGEITLRRTSAATAVAVKCLANLHTSTVTICGCGAQGEMHLRTMHAILPLERAYVFSRDETRMRKFAKEMSRALGIRVEPAANLEKAVKESGVCVTCTRSERYFLFKNYVLPGTFVAAVGADSPDKQELDPELLKSNTVVTDILEQCAQVGELHHALNSGMSRRDVYAELGEIVSGKKQGRRSAEQIIIFDSTGTALQDVAAAAAIYNKALLGNRGTKVDLFRLRPDPG